MHINIHDLGGTIRTRLPSETIEIIKPLLEKAGVTRVANITGLDCLNIPVYTAYRPNSKSLSTAQGKGITEELAICSALMEAIEHFYAENVKCEIKSSFNYITNKKAINPYDLVLGFTAVDMNDYEFDWSEARNLITQETCFIPTEYISLDFSRVKIETGIFIKSTTGLASGNTRDEAILHSLFENIERNCLIEFKNLSALCKKNLLLDVRTINDQYAENLISKLAENNIKIAIFDITNIFNIPTYHCIIEDNSPVRNLGHQSGTGTHFSKCVSLCRAITEAAQSRLTHISGAREDMYFANYRHNWKDLDTRGNCNYKERVVTIKKLGDSFDEQVKHLLNIFNNNGYRNIICYHHTPDKFPISVVHCIVPGLVV